METSSKSILLVNVTTGVDCFSNEVGGTKFLSILNFPICRSVKVNLFYSNGDFSSKKGEVLSGLVEVVKFME